LKAATDQVFIKSENIAVAFGMKLEKTLAMTASNILVIDEGAALHDLLQKFVIPEGYRVLEVTDGRSAERVIAREDVDIIVCDVKLLPMIAVSIEKALLQRRIAQLESAMTMGQPMSAFDLSSVEKLHIQRVLNYTHGNKVEAARLLNIGLTTVYRKIEEYGLG
jgi:DNA-binding NtrC family response regulator